ncbi:hypothetical protein ACOI1C_09640 [Bacillus sp. DJP31]|uniref:hypothetical protein n=1 Tax=Bacillus sp. DJP31 TaxID=3409789 RepID=UPI003BB6C58E
MKGFFMTKSGQHVTFVNKGEEIYPFIEIFMNGRYLGAFCLKKELSMQLPEDEHLKHAYVIGYGEDHNGRNFSVREEFSWRETGLIQPGEKSSTDYQVGDILVACDNVDGLPYGYMGHAALVVDEKNIIEAVMSDPIIRKVPISQFVEHHPIYAQFRPKDKVLGEKATAYAEKYLAEFQRNEKNGISKPIFYFTISTPLHDEWTYIYCSKLVWLSYHFGANHTFPEDHLWFAPEDLYTILSSDPNFKVIYSHPDYKFFIDL